MLSLNAAARRGFCLALNYHKQLSTPHCWNRWELSPDIHPSRTIKPHFVIGSNLLTFLLLFDPANTRPCTILPLTPRSGLLHDSPVGMASTFNAFDHLANVSLCSQQLGKVEIDCRFRHSKTQWGVLGPTENQAGILYMDLSFVQPKDCRFVECGRMD